MTNEELNLYIKHYIEKDKTGRAIMLTGAWGIGKSYYIKNTLIPFLEKKENGKHSCVVISLYGLSELSELSKAIFLEARIKKLNPKSEAGKAALLAGKTVIKGVSSFFGVDIGINERGLQSIYESINLSKKLLILEDVERTQINIIELLGYVNNLVEQDGVKVLLVTNEDELIKYKEINESVPELKEGINDKTGKQNSIPYTEETQKYLKEKEKTVEDTIVFSGNLNFAIKEIIRIFDNQTFQMFCNDSVAQDIVEIMFLMSSSNLRSVIFACQKTVDLFDFMPEISHYSDDYRTTIFYGILYFSFRLHAGYRIKWKGLDHYSLELGSEKYPLFRFCFDFIMQQHFDSNEISKSVESLNKLRLYDYNKTSQDTDLLTIFNFYIYSEQEVINAVDRISQRLCYSDDISFFDYGKIAVSIVTLKYYLGINIDRAKTLLIANLKGRCDSISEDSIFRQMLGDLPKEYTEEFNQLRSDMCNSLYSIDSFLDTFDYSPECSNQLYVLIENDKELFYKTQGFVKHINIPRFVEMFAKCTPSQMEDIRIAFHRLYQSANIADFLSDDAKPIADLLSCLQENRAKFEDDRIKMIQLNWFIKKLNDIERKFE